jgi:dolichol-phosphate mannosyltransferase
MALGHRPRTPTAVVDPVCCAVVPTRNEEHNVAEVVRRLGAALYGVPTEIVFVDDSDDDTPAVVRAVAAATDQPQVRLVHRRGEERAGGLGSAVVTGLRHASADWVCVLDGDLQHPPELVPDLLAEAARSGADLVIASRYAAGGRADGLATGRAAVSRAATTLATVRFPRCLRDVSDPMSGFFLVRRSALDLDALRPDGFKILLEILVSAPWLSRAEVSFTFEDRHAGASKAGWREGVRFGRILMRPRRRTAPAVAVSAVAPPAGAAAPLVAVEAP